MARTPPNHEDLEEENRRLRAELDQARQLLSQRSEADRPSEMRGLLRVLMDTTPAMAFIKDEQGRLCYTNDAFRQAFLGGRDHVEWFEKTDAELWPKATAEQLRRNHLAVLDSNAPKAVEETLEIEGEAVTWLSLKFPVSDADGKRYVAAVGLDITSRKREEQLAIESRRMESIGRLAGGVAHDFNNLLTSILGYAEITAMSVRDNDPLRHNLAEIVRSAEKASTLTRQLLAFARKNVQHPTLVNLNELIANARVTLRRLLGDDIELEFQPGKSLDPIRVDPGQIEQVLVNLVVNAREAMPDGGRLSIETHNVELDPASPAHNGSASGSYVLLQVMDTGAGMNDKTMARVFEPFYSTKSGQRGGGTSIGLGLSTCYGIVRQAGGHIAIQSEPDSGACFKIYLPRAHGRPVQLAPTSPPPAAAPRGTETILIVEDEALVLRVAATVLTELGYSVITAQNGIEALSITGSRLAEVSLLLADVVMPKMSGVELVEQLRPRFPTLAVILMSGYAENSVVHHGVADDRVGFLAKPFTPVQLATKVRDLIDTARP